MAHASPSVRAPGATRSIPNPTRPNTTAVTNAAIHVRRTTARDQ